MFVADTEDTLLAPFVYHAGDDAYPYLVRLFADWNETQYIPVVDGEAGEPLDVPLRVSFQGVVAGHAILLQMLPTFLQGFSDWLARV